MPTKRIEIDLSPEGKFVRTSGSYIEVNPVKMTRGHGETYNYIKINLQQKISDVIPENTRLRKQTLHFYVSESGVWNEIDPTHRIFNDGYSNNIVQSLYDDEWTEFNISNIGRETTYFSWKFRGDDYRDYFENGESWGWRNCLSIAYSGSNRPYLEVEYEYNPPVPPKSLAPNGETYNPRTPIRFSWNSEIEQVKYELQYKVDSGAWKSISRNSRDRFYEMPANTITSSTGKVYWRVRVAEESGVYSDYVDASFILGAVKQLPPRIIAPIGTYQENNKPVKFEWYFISDTMEKQKSWEIQYKKGDSTSWETIEGTGENESTTLDVQGWDSVSVKWKMRVTNDFGDTSEWTDEQRFQVIGAPPIPQIISVSNSNMPLITWNSREQEIYQIQITREGEVVYDTLKKVSKEKKHQVNQIIKDGKYLCRLTVYNAFSVSSPVAEFTFVIDTGDLKLPEIKVFSGEYFVTIMSESEDGKVLRDGRAIGKIKNGIFKDYTGRNNTLYKYQVVDFKDGVFTSSIEKTGKVYFKKNTISTLDSPNNYLKINYMLDGHLSASLDLNFEMSPIYIDGRKYPVFEVGNCETEVKNIKFFTKNCSKYIELISKKEEVLYREVKGINFLGVATGISIEENVHGYIVSFSLTKTGEI